MRIGFGFDVHRLVPDRELIIGGVEIPFDRGLLGHSDADVLLHAIADALLGAASLRDIGYHFPPTDERWRGADSRELLSRVVALIREEGYDVGNIDATICAERPKMNPHIPAMQATIARVLGVSERNVSLKATTTERLGFTGREEGIAAYAVALINEA